MRMKSGEKPLQVVPRKCYQPPRLTAFGKVHTIVAAGSGASAESILMISMTRRA
jgi:hypothetical protein